MYRINGIIVELTGQMKKRKMLNKKKEWKKNQIYMNMNRNIKRGKD